MGRGAAPHGPGYRSQWRAGVCLKRAAFEAVSPFRACGISGEYVLARFESRSGPFHARGRRRQCPLEISEALCGLGGSFDSMGPLFIP